MALSRILITLAAFAAAAVCAGFAFLLPAGGIYAILGPPLVLATPALLGFGIGHLFERGEWGAVVGFGFGIIPAYLYFVVWAGAAC